MEQELSLPTSRGGNRAAVWVRRISFLAIAVGLFVLIRTLPMREILEAVTTTVERLGPMAPVGFVVAYLMATVLMLPASPLSIVAGMLFGLLGGTAIVAAGATLGMAATFLIGRYVARPSIEKKFQSYPRYAAIDRAVGEGGWRIVALLRLSPAVPFNLQNYLYGLTAIRFWPCILASAVAILPGTFMYVYLGYAGRASLEAVSQAQTERGPAQWALLAVGLVATVAVTIYITRLARKALREQESEVSEEQRQEKTAGASTGRNPWISAVAAAIVALVILGAAGILRAQPSWFTRLFGPPQVVLSETYAPSDNGPDFDHSAFDALLKRYVNQNGGVDYEGLAEEPDALQDYIAALAEAPFDEMGRNERLALLINAYNAFTLDLILEWIAKADVTSIQDIPSEKRWDDERWNVGGHVWSLNQIEHEQIRPNFRAPNIHFALVCAAVGCPPLRLEAYTAARVNEQLEDQARIVHTNDSRWFQFDPETHVVRLTPLYNWYGSDFEQVSGGVLRHAAQYAPPLANAIDSGKNVTVEWLEYDWSLNNQENLK